MPSNLSTRRTYSTRWKLILFGIFFWNVVVGGESFMWTSPQKLSSSRILPLKKSSASYDRNHWISSIGRRKSLILAAELSCEEKSSTDLTSTSAVTPFSSVLIPTADLNSTKEETLSLQKISLLTFLFYGTLGSCLPFLPLVYRGIGLTETQIGVLGAISPVITFLTSPLWCAYADHSKKHLLILLVTFISSILLRSLSLPILAESTAQATKNALIRNLPAEKFFANKMFSLLGIMVGVIASLNAPVKPLLDAAILNSLTDKSRYGKSRFFGQIGFGLGSFGASFLLKGGHQRWFFAMHILWAIPNLWCILRVIPSVSTMSLEEKQAEEIKVEQKTNSAFCAAWKQAVHDPRVVIFFLAVLLVGVSSGVIENFSYTRLSEIGTDEVPMWYGIFRLGSSLAGGPMFWLSDVIMRTMGVEGMLFLSMLAYVIRFVNYALVTSPAWALPAELLRGLTFATFTSAATYYIHSISPRELTATMLSLLNAVFSGIGQSSGAVLGGMLVEKWGVTHTFLQAARLNSILITFLVMGLYSLRPSRSSDASSSIS